MTPQLYDTAALKKAANLSVNSDLLSKTRALNITLSATLEQALKEELAKREAARWVEENHTAIKMFLTPQVSQITTKHLKHPVGSFSYIRDQIIAALDLAVTDI